MFVPKIIRIPAVGAVTILATAGFMAPASASTASAHLAAGPSVAAKPNSNIVGVAKKVHYLPASLNVKWSGPTQQTCTTAKVSFTITNKAKVPETVTMGGKAFATIAAGKAIGICAWGTGTATGVFSLAANPKATLTVHVT